MRGLFPGCSVTSVPVVRTERQAGRQAGNAAADTVAGDRKGKAPATVPSLNPLVGSGSSDRSLAGLQRTAGNAATTLALGGQRGTGARGRGAKFTPALGGLTEEREFALPPYLLDLESGGLSTAYGVRGHAAVGRRLAALVGAADGSDDGEVVRIVAELAGRPESFYGQGRAFAVQGRTQGNARGTFDVTVRITRGPADHPPVFIEPETTDPEGKDTKVDVQHNTATAVGTSAGNTSSKGAGGAAFALAPVAPGLWVGGAAQGNVQPWQSSRESRRQKNVAEPRVLRSDKGSVEALRHVRFVVEVRQRGARDRELSGDGTLTQRVPTEHLVPARTAGARPDPAPLHADPATAAERARQLSLADSFAPVAVHDTASPAQGGSGLFDAVASVLLPSATAPGAPGRARLYEATSTTTVLEDLPRLLRDGVVGEDLSGKDGLAGSYRMRAAVTHLAPGWSIGKTQLRTHGQVQHTASDGAGKGRAALGGASAAVGVGALANAAAVRGTVMPLVGARQARHSVNEQTVSARQGAEVRGEKVLYRGTVRFTVEGTGRRTGAMVLNPQRRVATHDMEVWISLRADEAGQLGLPLPDGVTATEFISKPKRKRKRAVPEGAETASGSQTAAVDEELEDVERRLPFGAMGNSVTLTQVDTGPLVDAVLRLFATDSRLAGYLPAFGADAPAPFTTDEEQENQRRNYRELMAAVSETNLRVNKEQLLSTGIRARLRRKSRMHAHDVQVRITGALRETGYEGDVKDWMVRSHSGVASNAQSGRSSSRAIGGTALAQARLVPGVLTGTARYEKLRSTTRRGQAGPTTRTDVLTNGAQEAAVFGAALGLGVEVTMTTRPRKFARAVTPGAPGRHAPQPQRIDQLAVDEQDVRLMTPTEFTLDEEEKAALDQSTATRKAQRPDFPREFKAEGIGDLATLVPSRTVRRALKDWQLVESVGDGQAVRDLAFELLSRAAARSDGVRRDPALETEGLAPRLAIEERFSPKAITAALRQASSAGWVVKNLRYQRRLAALNGAVGTRLTLSNPRFVHESRAGAGAPGTETFVLGGHQATGQEGSGTTTTVQGGATFAEQGPEWRTGQGGAGSRSKTRGGATAFSLSGTVERNAHTPKKKPLYLVHCDLVVGMVAEVEADRGPFKGGPYVEKRARTIPATAAVWLTAEQLRAARRSGALGRGFELPESARESTREPVAEGVESAPASSPETRPSPTLPTSTPLGFGMIEEMPDCVPLLDGLRSSLRAAGRKDLAEGLLPRQQLKDRNDNVQRLLRVLDRDGSAGLLSSAMDGGVTVELLDGRNTPYWAVFKVRRRGEGTFRGMADDGRDLEYITSAASQKATTRDESVVRGAEGILAGSGKPDGGAGQLKSLGGAAGLGMSASESHRGGTAGRAQLGVKTVAEGTAKAARMRLLVEPVLELHNAKGRLALASLGAGKGLTFRILQKDLAALNNVERVAAPGPSLDTDRTNADRYEQWHAAGERLPLEAQVNGFQGAPRVRELVKAAVKAAGGSGRYATPGQSAAYVLEEAISTEWLTSALPLLTTAGADLPPVHATGAEGQDLRASIHARLRAAKELGPGDKMTFETVAQSDLDAPRPTQTDGQTATDHGRAARGLAGAGVLNAEEFRLNQLMANTDGAGGATDLTANSSGSMPLHKPKVESVLVQYTLDLLVSATVTNRVRSGRTTTAVRELTLPTPVVIRMPRMRRGVRGPSARPE